MSAILMDAMAKQAAITAKEEERRQKRAAREERRSRPVQTCAACGSATHQIGSPYCRVVKRAQREQERAQAIARHMGRLVCLACEENAGNCNCGDTQELVRLRVGEWIWNGHIRSQAGRRIPVAMYRIGTGNDTQHQTDTALTGV